MPMIELSARDINRSKVVTPAWYRVRIDSISEGPSAKGDSTNYRVEGTILCNADDGTTDFAEVPTPWWNYNSKAMGFVTALLKALGEEPAPGRIELRNAEGKEIEAFIGNKMVDGNMVNELGALRPLRK